MDEFWKIKTEIERLIQDWRLCQSSEGRYRLEAYKELLELIDSLKGEPVSKDLMDATNNYCVNVRKGYPRVMDETDRYICNAFKAGAQWQKEQMMNNVITADIGYYNQRGLSLHTEKSLERLGFNEEDKVKVLIFKEE